MEQIDLQYAQEILDRNGSQSHRLIAVLQAVQRRWGYLPPDILSYISSRSEFTPAAIESVAGFYARFRRKPIGRHLISLCNGTACFVKGSESVYDALRRYLQIPENDDTDPAGNFTIEKVACLGCCTLAPAVQIDNVTYGHQRPDTVAGMIENFLELQSKKPSGIAPRPVPAGESAGEIRLGLGSCCVARGSGGLHEAFARAVADSGINITLKQVGCVGMCHQTPLAEVVMPSGKSYLYARVSPRDAVNIIMRHFRPESWAKRLKITMSNFLRDMVTDACHEPVERFLLNSRESQVSDFLHKQQHISTQDCGFLDPTSLTEYQSKGGFEAFAEVLHLSQSEIIDTVSISGLRGRGGAGFPTGRKWQLVGQSGSGDKYVVCNGDEGDPGAFMDRMLLESYPFRVIEGMLIAARAIGATRGYLYIRAEYPLAVRRVRQAIELCREAGLLGQNIAQSDFSFELDIMEGAGAFICGEETALLESMEGRRGTPRLRPPYPAEKGLFGKPTLINNVETFSQIPWIFSQGVEAYRQLGTATSKGTKVFALAGKIVRGGLIEVPMGMTINEIIYDIGGGVLPGRKFKAVQIGGPSGGCIPAELGHLPVDYEALSDKGAIMGSGGLVVLDDTDCMVDIARYFLEFTQEESCGKCTFCRVGTRRMLELLDAIREGRGKVEMLDELAALAVEVSSGSLCGLGRTAPNPVLTTLRFFRQEYLAHIDGHCPAGKCPALIRYQITDKCTGCTKCAQVCPVGAIEVKPYEKHIIDYEKCIKCGGCKAICPFEAVVTQ